MPVDQTTALTRFRSIYKRMEAENASTQDRLDLAKLIHAEEIRRAEILRERREARFAKAKPAKRKDSLADLASLP